MKTPILCRDEITEEKAVAIERRAERIRKIWSQFVGQVVRASGCTDILVVLTRPEDFEPGPTKGILGRYWIEPRIKKHGRDFYRAFKKRHEIHTEFSFCLKASSRLPHIFHFIPKTWMKKDNIFHLALQNPIESKKRNGPSL